MFSIAALAQTASPVQSAGRPYKLNIADPVQAAGSDAASKAFQTNVLPGMLKLVNQRLAEYKSKSGATLSTISLDPNNLVLSYDASARVYFLGEGASYHNTLGISTTGGGPPRAAAASPPACRHRQPTPQPRGSRRAQGRGRRASFFSRNSRAGRVA
ncbi:hypothetical protein HQ447_15500 [bacterium]|nr:hypothetical protein [bacterium]